MTKDKLTSELQKEFAERIPGHQLQLLAVHPGQHRGRRSPASKAPTRSRSSVPTSTSSRSSPTRSCTRWSRSGASPTSASSTCSASPTSTSRSTARRRRATASTPATSTTSSRRRWAARSATTLLEGDRQFNVTVRLAPKYRDNIEAVGDIKVGYQTPTGTTAYIPLRELADITLDTGASYIYHESNAALHSDQVQRARPRPRQHRRGGAGAHRQERHAADRLPHRMGRRVRGAAAGQAAPRESSCRSAWC